MLTDSERATLAGALDALAPEGSFPWPSSTGIVDDFFQQRILPAGSPNPEWPGLDEDGLRAILSRLAGISNPDPMTNALLELERDDLAAFLALWRLAVFGYYSRPEVIAAIAADLAPDYHGAPLPLGYAHMLTPWDGNDPLQLPRHPRGSYVPTEAVQRVDLERLRVVQERGYGVVSAPDPVDVLIIGSGMAGAALAWRLASRGARVVCLEQGRWVGPEEHPHSSNEWELESRRAWGRSPELRRNPSDYPVTATRVDPMLQAAVGGSTLHYNAHWPRLKPVDFRKGTEHGLEGSADWPISYEDLAPYYELNDAMLGISGVAGDPANPPRSPRQTPPLPFGRSTSKLSAAFERLGWHWWPGDNGILTQDFDGRPACIHCGNCRAGCPRGSIAGMHVTYWPKALALGAELRTEARGERITTDARGHADGAVYIDLTTGERHQQRAARVVLCANGLGTPRLLFLSADAAHPDGVANSSGLVGRYLMHHAWADVEFVFAEPVDVFAGAYGAPIFSQEFYETDVERGFVNGFSFQIGRGMTAAPAALGLPWGAAHRAAFARAFNHEIWTGIQTEDLPVYENRVILDASRVDSSGLPGVAMHWGLHLNDERIIAFALERALELGDAAGALEVRTWGAANPNPAWHLMGTCRMGSDPANSVVDANHQAWDVPNLYICDGSSFVTGGAVNPTSTIGALALRCADRMLLNG